MLDGKVRYSRRSRRRRFERGGGFLVFGIGRRRGRERRERDVADTAVLRIEYEGAVGCITNVSVSGPEAEDFQGPSDLRARAVEFQVFDSGRAADVFSPEPLRVRRGNTSQTSLHGDPERNPKTRLLSLDVPDVDVAARGAYVDEVASRVEASVRRDLAASISGPKRMSVADTVTRQGKGAARTGWSPSLRPRLLPSRPRQVAVRAPTFRLLHLANRQRLVGSAHAGSQREVCCRSRK